MAIAGKVAITPGGEWSDSIAYDKLVVVTYNNDLYLSKKANTGVTPTDTENWQLLIKNVTQEQYDNIINGTTTVGNANKLGGKDASEYALIGSENLNTSVLEKALAVSVGVHNYQLGGSNYTGRDLPSTEYAWGTATIYKRNETSISVELHNEGKNFVSINSFNGVQWTGWGRGATKEDLANYLPLEDAIAKNFSVGLAPTLGMPSVIFRNSYGDIRQYLAYNVSGRQFERFNSDLDMVPILDSANVGSYALPITNTKNPTVSTNGNSVMHIKNSKADGTHVWLNFDIGDSELGSFGYNASGKPLVWANGKSQEILHTGNKPSGSYTGNGSATERTINVGGIGSVIAIWNIYHDTLTFVSAGSTGSFSNGVLTLKSADKTLNENGLTYYYQVL